MAKSGYKKYMKKESRKDYSIIKLFVFTFFGMLLIFTVLIKSFSPTVDTSIGDYDTKEIIEENTNIDNRLAFIQEEDNGKDFSEIIRKAEENMLHFIKHVLFGCTKTSLRLRKDVHCPL